MSGSKRKNIIISTIFVLLVISLAYFWWLSDALNSFAFEYRQLVAEEIRASNLSVAAQEALIGSIRENAPLVRGFEVGTSESNAAFMWSD